MDRPDLRAVAVLVSIFLNIILNFILVRWIGSIGAAIATTVSFAVSTVIIVYYLSKLITIEPPYREILSCFVSASIMASILFILRQKTGIRSLSVVISFVLLGGVLYITTVLAFPTIRGHIRDTLRTVIN